jgi:hypothetical protein
VAIESSRAGVVVETVELQKFPNGLRGNSRDTAMPPLVSRPRGLLVLLFAYRTCIVRLSVCHLPAQPRKQPSHSDLVYDLDRPTVALLSNLLCS